MACQQGGIPFKFVPRLLNKKNLGSLFFELHAAKYNAPFTEKQLRIETQNTVTWEEQSSAQK